MNFHNPLKFVILNFTVFRLCAVRILVIRVLTCAPAIALEGAITEHCINTRHVSLMIRSLKADNTYCSYQATPRIACTLNYLYSGPKLAH